MGYLLTVLRTVILALLAQTLIIRKDLAKSIPQEEFVCLVYWSCLLTKP